MKHDMMPPDTGGIITDHLPTFTPRRKAKALSNYS